MKVLVIGSGGREHALVRAIAMSKKADKVYCCPGNAGIAELAECIDIAPDDFESIINLVKYEWIDVTVVGPEAPLAKGIADAFEKEGLKITGPLKKAAQLEASKVFAKEFMKRHGIPTAEYRTFTSPIHAEEHVRLKGAPVVIKADGLAAGKGVIVAVDVKEAMDAIDLIMKKKAFGSAGDRVIIEECLVGEEASFMAFTDGTTILPMVSSQDHKRVYDGDKGPNTGGMGAYSPAPIVTTELENVIMETIIEPTVRGLKKEGIKYKGFLYAGLMISDGKPYVLEYNCRFGDPETQPVLMRLDSDFMDILLAIEEEKLDRIEIKWKKNASVCVVLASEGYPGDYEKGKEISGLDSFKSDDDVYVFHSGTSFGDSGNVTSSGGRVMGVTALGESVREARDKVYEVINNIRFDGMYYRKDIAHRAL